MQYLMPFVEKEKYKLPSRCRLHSSNDLFRDQEEHKIHVDINEWRCGYCKKIFRAEKYLDQHFDNRHYNLLNVVCEIVFTYSLECQLLGSRCSWCFCSVLEMRDDMLWSHSELLVNLFFSYLSFRNHLVS